MGDELVDRRRDIPRIGRCCRVSGEHRRGGHQRGRRVGRISSGLLNDGPEALYGRQAGSLQPVDRQWWCGLCVGHTGHAAEQQRDR